MPIVTMDQLFADGPTTEPLKVRKQDARDTFTRLHTIANLGFSSGAVYPLRGNLYANLAPVAGSAGLVIGDPTIGNDGIYLKIGTPGTGSWSRLDDVPGRQFVTLDNDGSGTANAIIATSSIGLSATPGHMLIALNITTTNTSGTVTLAANGGAARAIKTYAGNNPAVGSLVAGAYVLLLFNGTNYSLVNETGTAADAAAAQTARVAAEAAANSLSSANLLIYPTQAAADAATIPSGASYIVTADTSPYLRFWKEFSADPGVGDRFQSNDGSWWQGLPIPAAMIDPSTEISYTANTTLGAGNMNMAHKVAPAIGATVAITLPPSVTRPAGTLIFIRVPHDAAGIVQLKATAGQVSSLIDQHGTDDFYLWAGEAVLLQAQADRWHIIGKRIRPLVAAFTSTGADVALSSTAADIGGWALAAGYGSGLYLPAGLALNGGNIVIPRRAHYQIEFEAILNYSTAPTAWFADWKINGVGSGSPLERTSVVVAQNVTCRANTTRLLAEGQSVVPRLTALAGTSPIMARAAFNGRLVLREMPLW